MPSRTLGSSRLRTLAAAARLLSPLLLAACIVVPRTTTSYDPNCSVATRHVELEAKQIALLGSCRDGGECTALLVVTGVVGAASAVVSGSIYVVGNVVYWRSYIANPASRTLGFTLSIAPIMALALCALLPALLGKSAA